MNSTLTLRIKGRSERMHASGGVFPGSAYDAAKVGHSIACALSGESLPRPTQVVASDVGRFRAVGPGWSVDMKSEEYLRLQSKALSAMREGDASQWLALVNCRQEIVGVVA
jgi:hypothetical protein